MGETICQTCAENRTALDAEKLMNAWLFEQFWNSTRKMVCIRPGHHISPVSIASMHWTCPEGQEPTLVLTMMSGEHLYVSHDPGRIGGADAFAVEARILKAMEVQQA